MKYIFVFTMFATLAIAQPHRTVVLPMVPMNYTVNHASKVWFDQYQTTMAESTLAVYIKDGFYWQPDSATSRYYFSIDSIIGRGGNRSALFSYLYKTTDTSRWYNFLNTCDTCGGLTLTKLTSRSDSSMRVSKWLTYSQKLLDMQKGEWYIYAPGGVAPKEFCLAWAIPSRQLRIRMEKILGDPTVNFGWNQQAILKLSYYEIPSDSLWRQWK